MTPRRWLLLALAAAAVLLLAGRALASMYVDYAWFASMGATEVWRTRMIATITLRAISGVGATLFVFANLYVVRQSVVSLVLPRRVANLEIGEEVSSRYLLLAVVVTSLILGALLTIPQEDWSSFVLARSGRSFGESDPYFGADLGFFVYWLPFERAVFTWTLISIFIVSAIVLFLYALTPSLRWERGSLYVSAYVRRHLTVLAGVLLLMLAWSYRLEMFEHLTNGSGPDGMFTYVDHRVGIPGSLVLAIVTFGAALIVAWGGWTGQLRLAGYAIAGVLVLSLVVREAAPFLLSRVDDDSDPLTRERPYQAVYAGYTRRAFALDRIRPVDSAFAFMSLVDASRGVPMWDEQAVLRAARRTAGGELPGPEVGWYGPPGGLVAEIPERPARSDSGRAAWALERLLGSGADDQGQPLRVAQNGASSVQDAQLEPVSVLDTAIGYVILADSLNRVIGSPLEGMLSRIAHAWSFQRPQLLFDDLPRPHPTVVLHRGVRDRLHELAPFFAQGGSIDPVVLGDTLFWVLDLYSASASYPLARRTLAAGDVRTYFQHAATGVIQATTGETWIVPDSVLDPIGATWVRRFPALFSNWSALPASLAGRLPPAIDAVQAQAISFGRFGNRSGIETPMQPPILDGADSALAGPEPPFVTRDGVLGVAIPMLDANERVHGLVVGVGGQVRRTVWYPLADPVSSPRWTSVVDRLHSSDSGSVGKESGAPLYQGAVRAYPVGGAIAYVQSAYRWRTDGAPSLVHVGLLWGDTVRVGATLAQLAGAMPALPRPSPPIAAGDFRSRVEAVYRAMRDAMRRGDFAAFGRALQELGALVGPGTPP